MAAILFSRKELPGLKDAFSNSKYLVSEVVLSFGRLGSPCHGRTTVTVIRAPTMHDPTPLLDKVHVNRCPSVATLLAPVSKQIEDGWIALTKATTGYCMQADHEDNVKKLVNELVELHQLPPNFVVRIQGLPICDPSATTRLAVLSHWMQDRSASEGIVDVKNAGQPVHVDGTIPELCGGQILQLCRKPTGGFASWTQLLPIHRDPCFRRKTLRCLLCTLRTRWCLCVFQ